MGGDALEHRRFLPGRPCLSMPLPSGPSGAERPALFPPRRRAIFPLGVKAREIAAATRSEMQRHQEYIIGSELLVFVLVAQL